MLKRLFITLSILVLIVVLYGLYAFSQFPGEPLTVTGELQTHNTDHKGRARTYSVYVPAELEDNAPAVFVLHGSMGSGLGMRAMTGREFDAIADRERLAIVYPDGFDNHWNGCRGTADYIANTENIDDIGYLSRVIDELATRYGIDRTRVYITGISNGGHMAYRAALEAPGLFAAHAPVAASLPAPSTFGCSESGVGVSIAIFNGTGDPVNPYEGGTVSILGNSSRGVVRSSQETAHYWRDLAGLTGAGTTRNLPEIDGDEDTSISEERWGTPGSLEVRHYTLNGSGHTMPSRVAQMPAPLGGLLGGNAGDISGPEEIVAFFLGHTLNNPPDPP